MSNREAFIRKVLENPADDTARLVFADWLEEQDDKFSRDRALWFRGPHWSERRTDINLWGASVLMGYPDLPPSFPASSGCTIHRGFIEEIRLPLADFMRHAKSLFLCQPITSVVLTDCRPYRMAGGLSCRWHINFAYAHITPDSFLPPDFHRHLENCRKSLSTRNFRVYSFRNEQRALAALNRCCVAYGRLLAGLPKLETKGVTT